MYISWFFIEVLVKSILSIHIYYVYYHSYFQHNLTANFTWELRKLSKNRKNSILSIKKIIIILRHLTNNLHLQYQRTSYTIVLSSYLNYDHERDTLMIMKATLWLWKRYTYCATDYTRLDYSTPSVFPKQRWGGPLWTITSLDCVVSNIRKCSYWQKVRFERTSSKLKR